MTPYYQDESVTLHLGKCEDVLPDLPPESVDAIVTDPPAAIAFMGREWDSNLGGRDRWVAWLAECMEKAARVLKPGGHLLVWSLPRTSGWTQWALEDAGLEIRDCIVHLFGSGFPKNPNALKPGQEMWWLARKPFRGSVAANVLEFGTGALNIDGCRVDSPVLDSERRTSVSGVGCNNGIYGDKGWTREVEIDRGERHNPDGRWPANIVFTHSAACDGQCAPDCPVGELDRQSGVSTSTGGNGKGYAPGLNGVYGDFGQQTLRANAGGLGDTGGASRFYPTFRYQAKAPASERPRLDDGTAHETVKSLGLMSWLVRLITPPGGTVLDMFAGSGPVGEVCVIEGFRCVLIEQNPKSAELIKTRLAKPIQPALFGGAA